MSNIFDGEQELFEVPVNVDIDGKKTQVGIAKVTKAGEYFHVEADLKADSAEDIKEFLGAKHLDGISVADSPPYITDDERQALMEFEPHEHKPVQHRDARPPWCDTCGLDVDLHKPKSRINPNDEGPKRFFGKPSLPIHPED